VSFYTGNGIPNEVYSSKTKCLFELPGAGDQAVRVDLTNARLGNLEVLDGKTVHRLAVTKTKFGKIHNLPEFATEGVFYIIPGLVAQALKSQGIAREDCLTVDTTNRSVMLAPDGTLMGSQGLRAF
jgi:hypothetical protein